MIGRGNVGRERGQKKNDGCQEGWGARRVDWGTSPLAGRTWIGGDEGRGTRQRCWQEGRSECVVCLEGEEVKLKRREKKRRGSEGMSTCVCETTEAVSWSVVLSFLSS